MGASWGNVGQKVNKTEASGLTDLAYLNVEAEEGLCSMCCAVDPDLERQQLAYDHGLLSMFFSHIWLMYPIALSQE